MEKVFDSYSNANFYKKLYNTFPYHVKAKIRKKQIQRKFSMKELLNEVGWFEKLTQAKLE